MWIKTATCGQMPFTTTAQITICTVCSSAELPMRKLRICKTRSIAGERHAQILRESHSGLVTALQPSMGFGFQSSGHGSTTQSKTGHAEMRLTVRRNLTYSDSKAVQNYFMSADLPTALLKSKKNTLTVRWSFTMRKWLN